MPTSSAALDVQRDGNEEIDLAALLGTLIDHKWLIAGVTAAGFALGTAYALLAPPVYQANAMIQVEPNTPTLPGLDAVSQVLTDSAPQAVTEIALLTSRTVLSKAVDDLRLDVQVEPRQFPLIGGVISRRFEPATPGAVAEPWFGLDGYGWGGEHLDVFKLSVPDALVGTEMELVADQAGAYRLYDEDGGLLLNGKVGEEASGRGVKLTVKALAANPGMRFEVIKLQSLAIITSLQRNLTAGEKAKDSGIIQLSYELPDPVKATETLDAITRQYTRQNVERNSAEAANRLVFVKEQLPNVRRELEKSEQALNAYQSQSHSVDISLETKSYLDQIVSLDTSISQLKMQQAEVSRRYTPAHPAYRALMAQLGELEGRKNEMSKRIEGLPETQQELLRLTRDVQVGTQTYTNLLNQAQQLDIARAGTVGNARIVDRAVVDVSQPVKPKRLMIVLIATFLGGALAMAWILLRQLLNRGIEDAKEIEQLGLPVYASIPMSSYQRDHESVDKNSRTPSKMSRARLLAVDAPGDLAIEAIRALRTGLHFARLEAKNNVLMICGASPNAGKTFVSTNLASVIAQGGQRVLLIDADLRRGTLHRVMGLNGQEGLSDLLTGRIDFNKAMHASSVEGLHFIARGQVPPNPSELLMHPNFPALLNTVSQRYDLVIVDTPPILAVTDAAIVGRHTGTNLLVARFGFNTAKDIAVAKQRFEQNGIELKGSILNAVERRHGAYHAYGYDYSPIEK
ncbi:polysaccharide biosynthesis tyrosine autokinase [Lysobacter sp. BMK333-48F3]|uniref:polysaccharide biosynthesis tyrosine autokinase n=1 Tax=Lysobacter sp. BMK333-48F3 TaxID=2867962 RepID=UPI001C8C08C1|nr:polysaccharide biosynthesis tyrosine autokinase [Lysobacter sp. BMK333-48F3]MBX9400289.1 polysaccharide biosynthesis tyrosine autokinase [Lysobacter sp. BMK333-48F3]